MVANRPEADVLAAFNTRLERPATIHHLLP